MSMRPCVPLALLCLLVTSLLTGCSTSFDGGSVASPNTRIGLITGNVYGGRQPIAGEHVYVLAASTTGYGGSGIAASSSNASTSLLTAFNTGVFPTTQDGNGNYYVTSDSNGSWALAGEYTCVPGTQVYLYGIGGNAGGGLNSAAGVMAVLGNCPAGGTLAGQLGFVYMSEISTVAAAYAMAGFATDATHVGTTNSALAQIGIKNAFANANQLVDLSAPPNPSIQQGTGARTTTPNGNGTVPTTEINTIANILASCVNSNGPSSANCITLFNDAQSAGAIGTPPTDTATAAINIAHFPFSVTVSDLYGLVGSTAVPYQPALTSAPANWTVSIKYTGGGVTGAVNQTHGMAFDASGNLWMVSNSNTVLSEFSPLGVPINTSGFALSLSSPQSVAVDVNSSHVWIASPGDGTVTNFTISGATAANYTAGISTPYDIAIDASGNPWVTDVGTFTVLKLNPSSGAVVATASNNGLNTPSSVVIEPVSGNVWVANNGSNAASLFTSSATAISQPSFGGLNAPQGAAIDAGGNVWFANSSNSVSKIAAAATSGSNFSLGNSSPFMNAIAIDGAGNAWITDIGGGTDNTIFELSNTGTNLSGTLGYTPNPITSPDSIAIDGSGNVWYKNASPTPLRELIGAAAPVVTPIAYGVANNLLGTRP